MKILAISGSLRRVSTNTGMLEGLCEMAPQGMEIEIFRGLGALPVFSPDLEGPPPPAPVEAFIRAVEQADGIIIASPEYVRAIPGGLKNALDWLVSGDAIIHKPIALAHGSHRGEDMLASLRLVLGTVSTRFREDIFVRVPLLSKSPEEIRVTLGAPDHAGAIRSFLEDFRAYCSARPEG